MNRQLRNQKGITLVELLAVILIGSIVMVLIMSIFSNGQKQYSSQTTQAEQLNDVRYAAKVITKEIRQAEKLEWNDPTLTIGTSSPVKLTKGSDVILQGDKIFLTNIKIADLSLENRTIFLSMKSLNENESKEKTIETEIYIREGVIIDEIAKRSSQTK